MKSCILLIVVARLTLKNTEAFAPPPSSGSYRTIASPPVPSKSQLHDARGQFDISKPVFDLFAARPIRGDALLRYNSLNQSEPLRINLFALLALSLLCYPLISEAVAGEPSGMVQTGGSILGGLASAALFVRECRRRSNQLYRMEKELNSESLQVRLPMNALSDAPFTNAATVGQLRKTSNPPRIIAICGDSNQLASALQDLSILGRRLRQSTTYVVPVPTDASTRNDWKLRSDRLPWLADGYEIDKWLQYFDDLSNDSTNFRWLGLNSGGRSFGSGSGPAPQWLQLMGQYLRPTTMLDEADPDEVRGEAVSVFESQTAFYDALINGNLDAMKAVFDESTSGVVDEVLQDGGRLDGWESCLKEGARPSGMKVSGNDAVVLSSTEAYSTVVEFPADAAAEGMTATLLAVQQWRRNNEGEKWKLVVHQTIPWTSEVKAQGTLRCDCRGCVALTRDR